MILFVDETEFDNAFLVAGLLVNSREEANLAFKSFKNSIRNIRIPEKDKPIVYSEFKSTLLDRRYRKIKYKMLDSISEINPHIFYSCYSKKSKQFLQDEKEAAYIMLLERIASACNCDISIIFDTFNKRDFEERIINNLSKLEFVQAIMPQDSQKEAGLKYIDNICSVLRMHLTDSDENIFYEMIVNCSFVV